MSDNNNGNNNNGNNNQQRHNQPSQDGGIGCIGWLMEWGVFVLGAVLMFAKTSELLAAFAPKSLMGYVGIESLYGAASALMVEGLFVAIKITNDPVFSGKPKSVIQWITNTFIMLVPFAISLVAQPLDAFVIQGTLVNQPVEIQMVVSWGVPMIPGLIVFMIMVKSLMENLPDDISSKFGGSRPDRRGGMQMPKIKLPTTDLGMLNPRNWFPKKQNASSKNQSQQQNQNKSKQERTPETPNPTPASIKE